MLTAKKILFVFVLVNVLFIQCFFGLFNQVSFLRILTPFVAFYFLKQTMVPFYGWC